MSVYGDDMWARFGPLPLFKRIGVGRLYTQHIQAAGSQFDPDVTPAPAANIFLRGSDIGVSSADVAQQKEQSGLIAHRGVGADEGPPIHIEAANAPRAAKREFDQNVYCRSIYPNPTAPMMSRESAGSLGAFTKTRA
jgi:hypothetical protein